MYLQILTRLVKRHFLWMNHAGVLCCTLQLPLSEDENKSSEKLSTVLQSQNHRML